MAPSDIRLRSRQEEWLVHAGLLDHIEDAVVGVDADLHVCVWNRAAERLYGLRAEDALGHHVNSVISLSIDDEKRARIQEAAVQDGGWRGDVVAIREDGGRVDVDVLAVAIRDADGAVAGFYAIHRDISERKRAERQLAYQAQLLESLDDGVVATDPAFVVTRWNRGAQRMFGWTEQEALGRDLDDLIPTSLSPGERAAEAGELLRTGRSRGERIWTGKSGLPVPTDAHTVVLHSSAGTVSGFICIMRDITERWAAREALEGNERRQALVADLGLRGLGPDGLQPLLDRATEVVAQVLELDVVTVAELHPSSDQVRWPAVFGWPAGELATWHPRSSGSLVDVALKAGEPVISENLAADAGLTSWPGADGGRPVSAVATVIPGPEGPFGVLTAAARRRRAFNDADVSFVQAIANVVGGAAERSRAEIRLATVREDERRRIARDLHDDALQELSDALALAIQVRSSVSPGREEEHWGMLTASLRRVGQRLRGSIYDLRLSTERRGFAQLMVDLVEIQAAIADGCTIELHGQDALPAEPLGRPGLEALRIVREAIVNARRHAGAGSIRVDARRPRPGLLRVQVSDDGRWSGNGSGRPPRRGQSGITGMRERANLLGAQLRIDAPPRGGTTVTLAWPLPEAPSDEVLWDQPCGRPQ